MTEVSQRRIVVVGGGTAGWMTAAALGRFLTAGWSITVVESDEIGTIGVGEATIPSIQAFNQALDIDEAEFVAATGGTYKLGIAFEGWGQPNEGYVHALAGRFGVVPFHHYWLRGASSISQTARALCAAHAAIAPMLRVFNYRRTAPLPPALPFPFERASTKFSWLCESAACFARRPVSSASPQCERRHRRGGLPTACASRRLFVDCSGFRDG